MSSAPMLVLGEGSPGTRRSQPERGYEPPVRLGGRVSARRERLTSDPFGSKDYPNNVYILRTREPAPPGARFSGPAPMRDVAPPVALAPGFPAAEDRTREVAFDHDDVGFTPRRFELKRAAIIAALGLVALGVAASLIGGFGASETSAPTKPVTQPAIPEATPELEVAPRPEPALEPESAAVAPERAQAEPVLTPTAPAPDEMRVAVQPAALEGQAVTAPGKFGAPAADDVVERPDVAGYEPLRDSQYRNARADLERAIRRADWNSAVAAADELFILTPDVDWEAHLWAAKTHRRLGHDERAAELLEGFAVQFPGNRHASKSAYLAGRLFVELGDASRASANFNTVIDGTRLGFKRKARAALKKLEAETASVGEEG